MNDRLVARKRLIAALGYGSSMDDVVLMETAAVHIEQTNKSIDLPEYILAPPGVMVRGEDFLSPKLVVQPDGRVIVTGGDEACYLTDDFRLFYRKVPQHPLPWPMKEEENSDLG